MRRVAIAVLDLEPAGDAVCAGGVLQVRIKALSFCNREPARPVPKCRGQSVPAAN